ncbi:MAG TPA: Hsp70 family protein [Kofleriaceae bacterium]|nr:Hsp70 family protein [Kofleriaceae bacterium]
MSDPIVGIDLGTSNSVVAHADAAGAVKVLADDSGGKIHPLVVSFHLSGGVVVGAAAKQRRVIDPQNTIYSVKRLIGRAYRSPEVQTAKARSPFQIKEGPNHAPLIATRGGEFAVPEISAIVLDHVRNVAAARLATPVTRAVVTVPASFNDAQRSATATAGAIAGLTVVRVLNEPTAAALAYGHARNLRETIAVYDFGGGTFDITVLRLEDQVYEVLGTSGDTFLGGDDLDERLVDKMVAKFLAENRIDLATNEVAMMRLRAVAEQTKIELSRRARAVVRIDEIAYGPRGAPLNLQIEITRDEFVKEVGDLIDRTFPVCTEALTLAGLSLDRIADVILVGGTTKIPYVRDQVARFFGKAARTDVNPEDAVAVGAALQATVLERILARRPPSRVSQTNGRAATTTTATTAVVAANDTTASGVPALTLDAASAAESGAVMAPSELTLGPPGRARTAGADGAQRPSTDAPRPDTSYSVTRRGVRDGAEAARAAIGRPGGSAAPSSAVAPRSGPGASGPSAVWPGAGRAGAIDDAARATFEERTPIPFTQTQPIGRFAGGGAEGPGPQTRTAFGVPAAPSGFDPRSETLDDGGVVEPPAPGPSRPATAAGAGPPPVPRGARSGPAARGPAQPFQVTAPLPAIQRGPEPRKPPVAPAQAPGWLDSSSGPDWLAGDSDAGTRPSTWAVNHPATTQPLAPTVPIAPPTAPTVVANAADLAAASTARGMGAHPPAPSPSTTARGFQPPQGYSQAPLGPPPQSVLGPPFASPPAPQQASPLPLPPSPGSPPHSVPAPPFASPQSSPLPLPPQGLPGAPHAAFGAPPMQSFPVAPQAPLGSPPPPQAFRGPPQAPLGSPHAQPPYAPVAPPPPPAPVLIEVTPRGLGIATVGGFCEELIRRNVRVPTEARKLFSTSRDQQDMVRIVVCQGESRRIDNNTVIGDLVLQGLPPRPRGETSIEVTFSIDATGVLFVRARDAHTGTEQRATLQLVGDVAQDGVSASRDRIKQLRR